MCTSYLASLLDLWHFVYRVWIMYWKSISLVTNRWYIYFIPLNGTLGIYSNEIVIYFHRVCKRSIRLFFGFDSLKYMYISETFARFESDNFAIIYSIFYDRQKFCFMNTLVSRHSFSRHKSEDLYAPLSYGGFVGTFGVKHI